MRDLLRRLLTLALAGLLAGCADVSGPGTLRLEISTEEPLGAVALEVTGLGIQDVSSDRAAWLAAHPFREGNADGVRVVVILEEPGAVVLSLAVRDVSAVLPEVQVLEASDRRDRAIYDVARLRVSVRR